MSRRRSGYEASKISPNLPVAKFEETAADVKVLDENTAT